MPLLEIDSLDKHYEGVHALKTINLSLDAGTVMAVFGDNGAGKSTLMKCITGAEKPDNGRICFEGAELPPGKPHASRRAGIEMIYQNLNLCPQLAPPANIFLGREIRRRPCGVPVPLLDHKAMREKAGEIISLLNADIPLSAPVGKLSGGQQQAVAIARALLLNPRLLIMDEPTAALGARETGKVLALIRELKKKHVSVIIISHRPDDIYDIADRFVIMRRGEIREDKPADEMTLSDITARLVS